MEKLSRRSRRMPGFAVSFLIPRFFKAILFAPTVLFGVYIFFCIGKQRTIIYRPDSRHLDLLTGLRDVLVIGGFEDRLWAKKNRYSFIFFYPIYSSCHFGLSFFWRMLIDRAEPYRVLVWTDYGLDQYLSIMVSRSRGVLTWCFQHGLFPSENNCDLDGFDCDVNVVSSEFQADILTRSGYVGAINICESLFFAAKESTASKSLWVEQGCPVIFVGPGYSYNPSLEADLIKVLVNLRSILQPRYRLVYRPHPRDKDILRKIKSIGIPCERGVKTSFEEAQNVVFIGVKSTFLIEAQNAGKKVFLLVGGGFPKYFECGEIVSEINIDKLNLILDDDIFKCCATP